MVGCEIKQNSIIRINFVEHLFKALSKPYSTFLCSYIKKVYRETKVLFMSLNKQGSALVSTCEHKISQLSRIVNKMEKWQLTIIPA